MKTNMETPKKFYVEYSYGPNVSTFVFHPNAGPNILGCLHVSPVGWHGGSGHN